jgi:chorismate synthase
MSIPAVKAVEIGLGSEAARRRGSAAHDEIMRRDQRRSGGFGRLSNRAGGLEGGITTGEPLVMRAAMKPISTLRKPLRTVSLETGEDARAQAERSDVTAVPAMGVIAEAMVAIVLAGRMVEKFGGDSLLEMRANYNAYLERLDERWSQG